VAASAPPRTCWHLAQTPKLPWRRPGAAGPSRSNWSRGSASWRSCDVNVRAETGDTAVIISSRHKRYDCLRVLVAAGADVALLNSVVDFAGSSASSLPAAHWHPNIPSRLHLAPPTVAPSPAGGQSADTNRRRRASIRHRSAPTDATRSDHQHTPRVAVGLVLRAITKVNRRSVLHCHPCSCNAIKNYWNSIYLQNNQMIFLMMHPQPVIVTKEWNFSCRGCSWILYSRERMEFLLSRMLFNFMRTLSYHKEIILNNGFLMILQYTTTVINRVNFSFVLYNVKSKDVA
jgi:hypothetical protein